MNIWIVQMKFDGKKKVEIKLDGQKREVEYGMKLGGGEYN